MVSDEWRVLRPMGADVQSGVKPFGPVRRINRGTPKGAEVIVA